jgi:DNA topoisomerase-2
VWIQIKVCHNGHRGTNRSLQEKEDDLERQLAGIFPKINGNFDYLLNIKTVQYTEECVRELLKESKQAKEELEIMKGTSHIDMWKMDIKNM